MAISIPSHTGGLNKTYKIIIRIYFIILLCAGVVKLLYNIIQTSAYLQNSHPWSFVTGRMLLYYHLYTLVTYLQFIFTAFII